MMKFITLLLVLLSLHWKFLIAQRQCRPDIARQPCSGGDMFTCENQGCCYDRSSIPHCYFPVIPPPIPQCYKEGPRIPCGDMYIISDTECSLLGCCWDHNEIKPYCFFPIPTYIVKSVNSTTHGLLVMMENKPVNSSSKRYSATPITRLKLELTRETSSRLHVKISDPDNLRYEIPEKILPVPPPPIKPLDNYYYDYEVPAVGEEFYLAISDRYYGETLFNTSSVPFIFSDVFLHVGTNLPKNYSIYGFGERKTSFKLNSSRGYTLWNYNAPGKEFVNSYGSHPFYLEVRNKKAHGVFLRNSNGMDVMLDDSSLTYRVIGGVLDFYFFVSEMGWPDEIIHSYHEVIGRPAMPPYWALGYHQSRQGYRNLDEVRNVVGNFSANQIPLDGIWLDIDYMDEYKDFTTNTDNFTAKDLNNFSGELRKKGMKLVLVLNPAINKNEDYLPYKEGLVNDIFIKDHSDKVFYGQGLPGAVAYLDFLHPNITQYWMNQVSKFAELVPMDGLWLDRNEPYNLCNGDCATYDFYKTTYLIDSQDNLVIPNTHTTDMDTKQYGGYISFNTHNLYGLTESMVTRHVFASVHKGMRPFIVSLSTFPGSGVHVGHSLGNNSATADDLYFSIPGMLNFQMFGIPFVGANICGFEGNATEELCARWMSLGAFYPFSKNHNSKKSPLQEPYQWETVANISRKYLSIRYSLLPYFYTLFFKAHHDPNDIDILLPSSLVIKPLLFDFYQDAEVLSIDTQFLIGSAIMVSPQLKIGAEGTSVNAYFPVAKWYDWFSYEAVTDKGGVYQVVKTPLDHVPIHIRGGYIVPMQGPGLTTAESRKKPYSLIVALDVAGGSDAFGDVYLDDGESNNTMNFTYVQYVCEGQQLNAYPQGTGFASRHGLPPLVNVTILGIASRPSVVSINGVPTTFDVSYVGATLVLKITGLNILMDSKFTLDWV